MRTDPSAADKPTKPIAEKILLIGIGASAGGIEALQRFFGALPGDVEDMAFVVILHLDPEHDSSLAEVLQAHTPLQVSQATQRQAVKSRHVYVIPPNKKLEVADGRLTLSDFDEPRGRRTPIDAFFRSLARIDKECLAIVLSGTGADGTVGLKAVKEAGGLLLVQDPADAKHSDMPRNAIATGLVDVVAPAEALAGRVVQLREDSARIQLHSAGELPESDAQMLQRILTLLRSRSGHDFSNYKESTLLRRIGRRMQVNHVDTLTGYLDHLRETPEEAEDLFKNLLISVTHFFRDQEAWAALAKTAIPTLFDEKPPNEQIRVWVAGCATGEEAYTLTILLLEEAARRERAPDIQVFSTDIDETALTRGREGRYPKAIVADLTERRLRRFFTKEDRHYRVAKKVRERVLFATHGLLRDPPFSHLDLISCRNLLIYLNRAQQSDVFRLFHYALRSDGYLFLGNAESADDENRFFEVCDRKGRIYRRLEASGFGDVPILGLAGKRVAQPAAVPEASRDVDARHRRLLEDRAPPSLLVNRSLEILHLSESVGRYLQRPGGRPSDHILKEVRKELRLDLQAALHHAFADGGAVSTRPIPVAVDGEPSWVHLIVQPGPCKDNRPSEAAVLFAEVKHTDIVDPDDTTSTGQRDAEISRLRRRLQTSLEEYETSREEMKAANEELQSVNEEHKLATEELETSKEELQSVNEELETLNQELKTNVEQLSKVNSDLRNLMAATEGGILILDRELNVKRYTPRLEGIINVLSTDIGRPLLHLTHQLRYDELADDAEKVIRDLQPIEREVRGKEGAWFLGRMRPYRTVDDRIDGVVITFVDITELKTTEKKLRQTQESLEERVERRTRQVRSLSAKLTMAEQDERRRIAQILHDDLQQHLHGIRLKTSLVDRAIATGDNEAAREHLEKVNEWVNTATQITRQLTVGLIPPVLKSEGLVGAFSWLRTEMADLHGLQVELDTDAELAVPEENCRILIFQAVLELLFNVAKHAGVDTARIETRFEDDNLVVRVVDLGSGMDASVLDRGTGDAGFGLLSVRERLSFVGGTLEILSADGEGTCATIRVPRESLQRRPKDAGP